MVFLKPFPKGLFQFPNVFLFTTCLCALPHFLGDSILILGATRRLWIELFPLKCTCTPTFVYIFKMFTESLSIGYHQKDVVVDTVAVVVVVGLLSIPLTMGLVGPECKTDFEL